MDQLRRLDSISNKRKLSLDRNSLLLSGREHADNQIEDKQPPESSPLKSGDSNQSNVNESSFLDLPLDYLKDDVLKKAERRKVSLSPANYRRCSSVQDGEIVEFARRRHRTESDENFVDCNIIDLTLTADSPYGKGIQYNEIKPCSPDSGIGPIPLDTDSKGEFLDWIDSSQLEESAKKDEKLDKDSNGRLNVQKQSTGNTKYTDFSEQCLSESPNEVNWHRSFLSSAYVQNLAEICYSFKNDVRWTVFNMKVGSEQEPLFCWSKGDDVGILHAFANLYRPQEKDKRILGDKCHKCSCILCNDGTEKQDPNLSSYSVFESLNTGTTITDVSEDEMRRVHLYSRLFYRKGPWFRVDDVYLKYYAPKRFQVASSETAMEVEEIEIDDSTSINYHIQEGENESVSFSLTQRGNEIVLQHIDCVSKLLVDVNTLLARGWLRAFKDEAECGKTVGQTLLQANERKNVLLKLGYRGNEARSPISPKRQKIDNKIWKQMRSQKTLVFKKSEGNANFLPVQCHVDTAVLDTLIQKIIQLCSSQGVRFRSVRNDAEAIKEAIKNAFKRNNKLDHVGFPPMTFRKREQAELTLQRCSRLYLCATNGPGDMRSDGLNAWRCLLKEDVSHPVETLNMLDPPSQSSWHHVQYPGLLHRFGIRSYFYMDSHSILFPKDSSGQTSRLCQVFSKPEAFTVWEICSDLRATVDYLSQLNEILRSNKRRTEKGKEVNPKLNITETEGPKDLFGLLNVSERYKTTERLLLATERSNINDTVEKIEYHIQSYLPRFQGSLEKVLGIVGIICLYVVLESNKFVNDDEVKIILARPWLRHLVWQGCLAYILWDIIPLYERCGLHQLAVQSLEVLLFGSSATLDKSNGTTSEFIFPSFESVTILAPALLSRRARGKAFERLVLDLIHWYRRGASAEDKSSKRVAWEMFQSEIVKFCEKICDVASQTSCICFSSLRRISMRLKRPLIKIIGSKFCPEAFELGIRLENENSTEICEKRYSDWSPVIDRAVANSLYEDRNGGMRCSFVGFEDEDVVAGASLNVEQLAMEFYRSGRLPADTEGTSKSSGGWIGFHDEGGHVRALFRILCSAPLLGMDWGCGVVPSRLALAENSTIFLSPYQDAPFDLHVGFELVGCSLVSSDITVTQARGFYYRHQRRIVNFLEKLENLSQQELCDLVQNSISNRLRFMIQRNRKDPFIERDLAKSKLLSLIAAGCGGRQLASIFRCLLFDYRHYSGGLPDLLLVRARHVQTEKSESSAAYLEEWVSQNAQLGSDDRSSILFDKDDEFLGCNKVGDSGGRQSVSGRFSSSASVKKLPAKKLSLEMVDDKLLLEENGRNIIVECMMVEVKSSNDRLDPRQEDWLNVLDRNGNARVCKFEKGRLKSDQVTKKESQFRRP